MLRAAFNPPQTLCEREPNFQEMYEHLGDFEKQQTIRMANPGVRHCRLLEKNPRSCTDCQFNPYLGDFGHGLYSYHQDDGGLDQFIWLEKQIRLGSIRRDELNPIEAEAVEIVKEEIRRLERLEAAKLMANEVAAILAKALGGTSGG